MDGIVEKAGIGHNSTKFSEIVEADPKVLFRDKDVRDAFLAEVEADVSAAGKDIATEKGRKAIASLAYGIARRKTAIDEAGKELNEAARKQINAVDEVRRVIRDRLDKLKDAARAPLDAWEAEQKARAERIEGAMSRFRELAIVPAGMTADEITARIGQVEAIAITDEFGDRAGQADVLKVEAISRLRDAHAAAVRAAEEAAELARLRAEAAERERAEREARAKAEAEAAENARIEAAAKAAEEAARVAAERKAREEREALERAHAAALRAEQEKAAAAERARIEQEQRAKREKEAAEAEAARIAAEERRRQEDIEHRSNVMRAAKDALIEHGGVKEDAAKKIVLAIAGGQVPHVSIRF